MYVLIIRARDLCQQGDGPGLSFPIPFFPRPKYYMPCGFCGRKAPHLFIYLFFKKLACNLYDCVDGYFVLSAMLC